MHVECRTTALKVKLRRLFRVREELREEGESEPPELEAKIQEVRQALEFDQPEVGIAASKEVLGAFSS